MVLLSSHRIPRVPWYSGYTSLRLNFAYETVTLFGLAFQLCSAIQISWSKCPSPHWISLFMVWALSLSLTTTQEIDCFLSLPPGTKMFQFPGFPSIHYVFMYGYLDATLGGFPHSEICGSKVICTSPQLIAACHVLLRRLVPRHPPYALYSLISS